MSRVRLEVHCKRPVERVGDCLRLLLRVARNSVKFCYGGDTIGLLRTGPLFGGAIFEGASRERDAQPNPSGS